MSNKNPTVENSIENIIVNEKDDDSDEGD